MSETIYDSVIEVFEHDSWSRFNIDLKKKTLKVNGKTIIDNGKYDGKLINEIENPWEHLEDLYESYLYSRPTEKYIGSKPYFLAKEFEELEDEDVAFGENRNLAQLKLELFILCASLQGFLQWKNKEHWYWVSKVIGHEDFIILKEWM